MAEYLVEVSLPERGAMAQIASAIRTIGSHFATHADWRRKGGVVTGSMIVDAPDRIDVLAVVPPAMRGAARVVRLDALAA